MGAKGFEGPISYEEGFGMTRLTDQEKYNQKIYGKNEDKIIAIENDPVEKIIAQMTKDSKTPSELTVLRTNQFSEANDKEQEQETNKGYIKKQTKQNLAKPKFEILLKKSPAKIVEIQKKYQAELVLVLLDKYNIKTAGGLQKAIGYTNLSAKYIQKSLQIKGLYTGNIDGKVGPLTLLAYKQYRSGENSEIIAKNEKSQNKEIGRNKIIRGIPVNIVGTDKGKKNIQKYGDKIIPEVIKVAKKFGVETSFILAIVDQEGEFNPYAGSKKGARGLMQLMPSTAKGLGITNITNISQNLNGGTKYISKQLKRFGTKELALAAYNAGPGNVRKYKGIPPFKETRQYIKNVMRNYFNYKKIEHKIV